MKRIILLVCLGLLPCTALAQDEPRTYVIKKGDTLWGISERFMTDPEYWPALWSHNPDISNPHFIYPGQQIRIIDGRLELVPLRQEASAPKPTAAVAATVPEAPGLPDAREELVIRTPGGASGFLSTEELETAGILVDTVDNRLLMAADDKVFVDMKNLAATTPGERYTIFDIRKEVAHPVTGKKVGVLVGNLGELEVTEINRAVATAMITSSAREITRGARLRPWQPPRQEVALKQARQAASGYILAGADGQIALGQHDLIYVDLGAETGLEPGNLLYISRPREASEFALQKGSLQLPDIMLGTAVVLEARPETATALILKMTNLPMRTGDRVTTATE